MNEKPFLDVNELQNFVNVALTVVEDDLSNDRLSNLRTVGSGFASLIYGLKEDIGFRTLYDRCLSVWAAYQKNMKLTDILVSVLCWLCVCVWGGGR